MVLTDQWLCYLFFARKDYRLFVNSVPVFLIDSCLSVYLLNLICNVMYVMYLFYPEDIIQSHTGSDMCFIESFLSEVAMWLSLL